MLMLPGDAARGPGPLEIEATRMAGSGIRHCADKEQVGLFVCFPLITNTLAI